MQMPSNEAAWLDAPGQPLRVGRAEMPTAGRGEIVIRNQAVAINPISWKVQDTGIVVQKWPVILDYDVAGSVHSIGDGVSRFREGDRVVAWLQGPLNPEDSKYGAFQLYSVAKTISAAKLPDNVPFADACVLPVACNTAVVALCGPPTLGFGLTYPSLDSQPAPSGKTIIVWGASSSVGITILQLARAAGIKAIAVASAHNFELCMASGAVQVLDYHEPSIVQDVIQAVQSAGGEFVGIIDCVSLPDQSLKFCIPVFEHFGGGELGFLLPNVQPDVPNNVRVSHVFGRDQEITQAFWEEYLSPALEQGKLKCLPQPLVAGHGLESLQTALDIQRKGVSAKKVVVTL